MNLCCRSQIYAFKVKHAYFSPWNFLPRNLWSIKLHDKWQVEKQVSDKYTTKDSRSASTPQNMGFRVTSRRGTYCTPSYVIRLTCLCVTESGEQYMIWLTPLPVVGMRMHACMHEIVFWSNHHGPMQAMTDLRRRQSRLPFLTRTVVIINDIHVGTFLEELQSVQRFLHCSRSH
jgi:hypothetical protein